MAGGTGTLAFAQLGSGAPPVSPNCAAVHNGGGGGKGGFGGGAMGGCVLVLAGLSTSIAGSPTDHALRKNSSNLQSTQGPIGPTPMRFA